MKKVVAIFHLIILLLALSSPFWLDWKIVLLGTVLLYLQYIIFKGCLLTFAQFGEAKVGFTPYYLSLILAWLGIHTNPKKLSFYLNAILPPFVVLIAILYQVVFNYQVWLKL